MDRLVRSCDAAAEYPKILVCRQDSDGHVLDEYVKRLDDREDHLFSHESEAALHFWQFDHEGQGAWFAFRVASRFENLPAHRLYV